MSGPGHFSGPVHPRACGERNASVLEGKSSCGSSPRVRGTPGHTEQEAISDRFIPARAGNAVCRAGPRLGRPVHPRACGERPPPTVNPAGQSGSSPRVRGTHRRNSHQRKYRRFIPARAGNAMVSGCQNTITPVHPRACGERPQGPNSNHGVPGSSPRVRGTHRYGRIQASTRRFIPARAGNA